MKFLTEQELGDIYEKCVEVLSKNGVEVKYPKALDLLAAAGAQVDRATEMVRFPKDVIQAAIDNVPRTVTLGATVIPDPVGRRFAESHSGSNMYYDTKLKRYREATVTDVAEFAQLQEQLPEATITSYPFPNDVPKQTADIYALRHHLENTAKPTVVLPLEADAIPYLFELLKVVHGSANDLSNRAPASIINSMVSPFIYKPIDLEAIMQGGRHGIPLQIATCTIAGVSSPITVAGHIVVAGTEILAGLVMAQMLNPGCPCIANPELAKLDMATGSAYIAGIEDYLCTAGVTQMAKEVFQVPVATKMITDSHAPDAQAAFEKGVGGYMGALSGADVLVGLGGTGAALGLSPLQLIMDDSFVTVIRRAAAGIAVNEDTLAMKDILSTKPGGTFLQNIHTVKH